MTSLTIPRDLIFSDIEELAAKVYASDRSELRLPNDLHAKGAFGIEAACMQLISTWLRNSEAHVVHTYVNDASSEAFEKLCNSLYGIVALRLSDQIFTSERHEVSLGVALASAVPRIQAVREEKFGAAFKGGYLALPCIRSEFYKGKNREFDSPLYNQEQVVSHGKFRSILDKAIDAIVLQATLRESITDSVKDSISGIVRELFSNTHKHARVDVKGNPLSKNFRAVTFTSQDVTEDRLKEISKSGGVSFVEFMAANLSSTGKDGIQLLDICVADSGPGFARKWTGKEKSEMTVEEERMAVLECFKKHATSDSNDSSGIGLTNVLSDVRSAGGWFRLSTGRTVLEKSYMFETSRLDLGKDDFRVREQFLEGTVFSVVIPLRRGV
jgi:hypothetical protein